MTTPATQPPGLEYDVLLKDGSTVHLRPARPGDEERIATLYERMSDRSRYLRFHRPLASAPAEELQAVHSGGANTLTLVATQGEPGEERIIAIGRFIRRPDPPDHAEVAFAVEDSHQGRGIASQLLDHLAAAARALGIVAFEADVLDENQSMMEVFRASGYPVAANLKYGTFHVAFPIGDASAGETASAERDAQAAAASLRPFFHPASVAVIGASRRRGTIGAEVFHNILENGYTGVVYPVNKRADAVAGVRAYPSVTGIAGEVDLAIVVVPADQVLTVADECARKGVRGLVVISAGFRETGGEGAKRERDLLLRARRHGMRIIGPNCMGVLNANPAVSFNGTFSPVFPPFGNVALLSQSGALGIALLDYSREINIGLSTFASVGNKADVSGNDLIQYWESDPDTRVILLYLESFGNPRRFASVARRISAKKPIVAVKSGRSAAGSRAASSHTGSLATLDIASDALFRQAGVIRVDTLEEMFDVASLLAHQPVPKGKRVAILTNAGGPGILAADACEARGLSVLPLSLATREKLAAFLPKEAGLSNPVDMIASAGEQDYERALRILVEDPSFDSVIVIFIPPLITQAADVAAAIRKVAPEAKDKTLLTCFMSTRGAPAELTCNDECSLPSYIFPESAAMALASVSDYAEWLKRPAGRLVAFDADTVRAREIVAQSIAQIGAAEGWLDPASCAALLECYGIRAAATHFAATADEASSIASRIGFPVAVKLASTSITHKSDVGGVVVNVTSEAGARHAFEQIRANLRKLGRETEMQGAFVQQMVAGSIEAIVGVTQDRTFGPLMMFGLGGTLVELLKDVVFRIHPLTDVDAREMVRSIKSYPVLEGWRGSPRGDVAALEELLLRVSALISDIPEIAEMDLNPIKVLQPGDGCCTVDARVLLRSAPWTAPATIPVT